WVSESLRSFEIVKDRGFISLMKTGQPEYYIPTPKTVARDVRLVFDYTGKLNFATDAWTLPNHCAYVAVSVHLEHEGQLLSMILDIVEVSKVKVNRNIDIHCNP
ncbi:hypothetical protein CY34DRAFT_95779, partial [Suillus luteus UH-Slu-Lm8-n1]